MGGGGVKSKFPPTILGRLIRGGGGGYYKSYLPMNEIILHP